MAVEESPDASFGGIKKAYTTKKEGCLVDAALVVKPCVSEKKKKKITLLQRRQRRGQVASDKRE